MATNSQYLNGKLSDAQIEQLIQSLRGIKPVENDILDEEKSVNKVNRLIYTGVGLVLTDQIRYHCPVIGFINYHMTPTKPV
jgi:hypothetical protein